MNDKIVTFCDPDLLKDDGSGSGSPVLVGSIDQGTSSTRFLAFTREGRVAASAQAEHAQIFPPGPDRAGWHEHDPLEIWRAAAACVGAVAGMVRRERGAGAPLFGAVGITNQRETAVAWNAATGRPYYNAVVWDDARTAHLAHELGLHHAGGADRFRTQTGLPLASYFSGTKVRWLLDNVPDLQRDLAHPVERENVRFGTIDTWLAYQLTGSKSSHIHAANVGGQFITDVSNASRWLFLDIHKVAWDENLIKAICGPHDLPLSALPTVMPSSHVYAKAIDGAACGVPGLDQVPLAAILGDQQAALFGQCAFEPGEAKNTYGTGLFLMMNTGTDIVPSTHGLLTTIAYQLSEGGDVVYALEGSVSHSGSTLQWLRDRLDILPSFADIEKVAAPHSDGLYFVPAFAGLFAPHWRSDARACIVGLTATHTKGHVVRAALEATAHQARDVFDAMFADSKVSLATLKVDGGGTSNDAMMQFQADMIGVDVVQPVVQETTAMGAAFCAGLAVGVWDSVDELKGKWAVSKIWKPQMAPEERIQHWRGWQKAITKSVGWIEEDDEEEEVNEEFFDAKDASVHGSKSVNAAAERTDATASSYSLAALCLTSAAALMTGILVGRGGRK